MIHAGLALQKSLYGALAGSSELVNRLGGAFVYDDVPEDRPPPYIVFAPARHITSQTGTDKMSEHHLWIHVWSREQGRQEVIEISNLILERFSGSLDEPEHHWLVNFHHQLTDVEQDPGSGFFVARMRFRAITEPRVQD